MKLICPDFKECDFAEKYLLIDSETYGFYKIPYNQIIGTEITHSQGEPHYTIKGYHLSVYICNIHIRIRFGFPKMRTKEEEKLKKIINKYYSYIKKKLNETT